MPNKNILLEAYLAELESGLKDLSPSDRSKIVRETFEKIEDSHVKYPDKSTQDILSDLGPATTLANHCRLERGHKTYRPQKVSIVKWISLAIVGSATIFVIAIGLLVWKFTPIFKIDEKNQRVIILGGLIDVNGISGKIKVGDTYQFMPNRYSNQFNGSLEANSEVFDEIVINFKSGILNIKSSGSNMLVWDCQLEQPPSKEFLNMGKDIIEMDLEKTGGSSCNIEIPQSLKLTIDGTEGQINLLEPENDTFVEMDNGTLSIGPNPEQEYRYDLKVEAGTIADFESAPASNKDAIEIRANIKNGAILKN